jgi:hypothetical protein
MGRRPRIAESVFSAFVAWGKGKGGRQLMSASTVEKALEHSRARLCDEPEEDIYYTWLKDYLQTLEGKEARLEYYAWLEEELSHFRSHKEG